jgi:hypothetical protein
MPRSTFTGFCRGDAMLLQNGNFASDPSVNRALTFAFH